MGKKTIIGENLTNIPWQERPQGTSDPVWRYSDNPIIPRDILPDSNSVFNSAVVPFGEGFAGVFRCDTKTRAMDIHAGFSEDGIQWRLEEKPIAFQKSTADLPDSEYKYDPRVVRMDEKYYITWCNGYNGPTIGLGHTSDFKKFVQEENSFLPFNRNGVLFPRKIRGHYAMVSRPSDTGHTPFGDIFYSESPDLVFWGKHRHVMRPLGSESLWQSTKIGAGPIPLETTEGWLMVYHGVLNSCNGFVYSMGAALLDLDEPWKVLYRTKPYLLNPRMDYECVGDVPNVAFPCAMLSDAETGRLAIYYGGADTVVALAFAQVDELIHYIKSHSV